MIFNYNEDELTIFNTMRTTLSKDIIDKHFCIPSKIARIDKTTVLYTYEDTKYVSIDNFLQMIPSKKDRQLALIEIRDHLLETINILKSLNIVCNYMTPIIDPNNPHLYPLIYDFSHAFFLTDDPEKVANKHFCVYDPTYSLLMPEVHVLCYLVEHNLSSFSQNNVEKLRNELNMNTGIDCEKYINCSKSHIIQDIQRHFNTLDTYALNTIITHMNMKI